MARVEAGFLRRPLYFLGLSGVYDLCEKEPFDIHIRAHMYDIHTYYVHTCMVFMHKYT